MGMPHQSLHEQHRLVCHVALRMSGSHGDERLADHLVVLRPLRAPQNELRLPAEASLRTNGLDLQ